LPPLFFLWLTVYRRAKQSALEMFFVGFYVVFTLSQHGCDCTGACLLTTATMAAFESFALLYTWTVCCLMLIDPRAQWLRLMVHLFLATVLAVMLGETSPASPSAALLRSVLYLALALVVTVGLLAVRPDQVSEFNFSKLAVGAV